MKVIMSHDIDDITVLEHAGDFRIPKYVLRSFLECLLGSTSLQELKGRMRSLIRNKWQNIHELMEFDRAKNVPSTFFLAVSRGRGLAYSLKESEEWAQRIIRHGFDVGIHGIAFDRYKDIVSERDLFRRISGKENFGIRIHGIGVNQKSVRLSPENLQLFEKAGYLFSSNTFSSKRAYQVGKLIEFPIHIMESQLLNPNGMWQTGSLDDVKEKTLMIIDKARDARIDYFSVLFHDVRFSANFDIARKWYFWFVDYCLASKMPFISYADAVRELQGRS